MVEARYSRWRVLLLTLLAAGFVVLGLWVLGAFGEPPRPRRAIAPLAAWICILFFGSLVPVYVRRMFDDDVQMRIDARGIYDKRWSSRIIPWDEVSDVGVWAYKRNKSIVLSLRNPDHYRSEKWLARTMTTPNRKLTGGDVMLNMTGTDVSFADAMAAIERFWKP